MYALALTGAAMCCYFLFVATQRPRVAVFVAAILWLLYAIFELAAARGALADGTSCDPTALCNLGIDLFLWPILLIASVFASYEPGKWTVGAKRLVVFGLVVLGVLSALLLVLWLEDRSVDRSKRGPSQTDVAPKAR